MRGVAFAAAVVMGTWTASAAHATTFHVSPGGSDRANGREETPWKTLAYAVSQLRPGDTLLVKPGRYTGFRLRSGQGGAPGARVRIMAEHGAVIDTLPPNAEDGINIEGASYVDIEGFRVTGAPRAGIRAIDCLGVHIRGNEAHENGRWGIFTGFCDDLVIENNIAWGSRREHGIYVSNSARNPIIRGNHLFDNAQCGVHMNGDVHMGGEGMITGALVENNVIYGNGRRGGAGINSDGLRDSTIRNNILYDNHSSGITLYRIDGRYPSTGNNVLNNTIVMPRGDPLSRWCIRIVDGSAYNVFKNNICLNGHPQNGAIIISPDSLPGFISDSNLVDGRFRIGDHAPVIKLDAWRGLTGQDMRSLEARYDDGLVIFRNPRTGDHRLRPGSPAIGHADRRIAPRADYAGHERAPGPPDMGALEYCGRCTTITPLSGPVLGARGPALPADVRLRLSRPDR